MRLTPISYNTKNFNNGSNKELCFGHGGESFWKSDYSKKDKFIVAGTTALGIAGSLLALAKCRGNSIKPKAFWKFLKEMPIEFTEVITMGAGTCLGGLAGGYLIDKDPLNRKAKRREAVMQMGNISIPIGTVALTKMLADALKVSTKTLTGKSIRAFTSLGAILGGIYLANFIMNKVSNNIFKESSNERGVKGTDLFPHIDDVLVSGRYILPESKAVHNISRIVPIALMVAGNEVGNKKAN
jgi:hypothetical protein